MEWPEWAVRAWEPVGPYAEKLAVWRGYEAELQTLLIYAVGIALYIGFVFAFYQGISKRTASEGERRPGFTGWLGRLARAWLVFPLLCFAYFSVLVASLFLLAKSQETQQIFLVAMSVVVGVRVVVYVSEGAATDLAKLLPLGLLGVLIVDPTTIQWSQVWARFVAVPSELPLLGRYFLLFLVLEGVLKTARRVIVRVGDHSTVKRASKPLKGKVFPQDTRRVAVKSGASGARPREGPAAPAHDAQLRDVK